MERKNAGEFPVQRPSSQASVGSSDFTPGLEARVHQPRAELAVITNRVRDLEKENKEQAERIRVLEFQNAALIAARDAIRGERDAARHERQNVVQQRDEALRRQAEAERERDAARAEVAEMAKYKSFFNKVHNGRY